MNFFITGSQTEAHKLRMLKEAVKFLFKVSLFSLFVAIIICFYKQEKYALRITWAWYKADILKTLNGKKSNHKTIEIIDINGFKKKVLIKVVLNSREIIQTKNNVIDNFITYIKYSLIVPIILPFWFYFAGKRRSAKKHIRGFKIVKWKTLRKLVKKYNDKNLNRSLINIKILIRELYFKIIKQNFNSLKYMPYFVTKDIEYPAFTEHQHTFVTGGSGTGKTVFLLDLIDQIKQRGDVAIIYDKMGSFIPYYYKEKDDIILNPFDLRSKDWNIFAEVREGFEETDLRTIIAGIIPKSKIGDNFWNEQAQNLFIAICIELIKRNQKDISLLAEYILKKEFRELREFLKDSDVKQMFESDEQIKMTQSIRSTLISYTHFLKILSKNNKTDINQSFSIRNFVEQSVVPEQGSKFLFLSSRSDVHETLQPLLTAQINIAINTLLSLKQQKERNIWIILDELPSINEIFNLDVGLAQARQFGGSFVLSMQLISQLRDIYGDKKADTISGNCKTRIIFASPDSSTAEWSSKTLGKSETDEVRETINFGANEIRDGVGLSRQVKMDELVIPSEIQMLPNLNFYLKLPFDFPISKINIKPKMRNKICDSFVILNAKTKESDLLNDLINESMDISSDNLKNDLTYSNSVNNTINQANEVRQNEGKELFNKKTRRMMRKKRED